MLQIHPPVKKLKCFGEKKAGFRGEDTKKAVQKSTRLEKDGSKVRGKTKGYLQIGNSPWRGLVSFMSLSHY